MSLKRIEQRLAALAYPAYAVRLARYFQPVLAAMPQAMSCSASGYRH